MSSRHSSITVGGPKKARNRAHAFCSIDMDRVNVGILTPFSEMFNAELTPNDARRYANHILVLAKKAEQNRRLLKLCVR